MIFGIPGPCRSYRIQRNPEGGAYVFFGGFDEYLAEMVVFNNSFGQCEAQPPTALAGGKSRLENHWNSQPGNAFSRVGDVYEYLAFAAPQDLYRDGPGIAHGVDGIFAKVFDHPFEERHVYPRRDVV